MERILIVEKLKIIISSILKVDNLMMNDTISAKDVEGWDSLSHMVIITEVEKFFKIQFKLKELNKLTNMGNLISLIELKLN
jgi:acyl carrier protein